MAVKYMLRIWSQNLKIQNGGSNMTSNYMILSENFKNFVLICLGTVTRGFLRSLITNLKSESQNSKWRI